MHHIQELQEDGREAAGLVGGGLVAAVGEAVAEWQPLLLHQHAETLQGAVVRVHAQLRDGDHLGGERSVYV